MSAQAKNEACHILVLSDSHGYKGQLSNVLLKADQLYRYDALIHLGDGYRDVDRLRDVFPLIYQVPGNCDGDLNGTAFWPNICGITVFMTHGHGHHVKTTLNEICRQARSAGAAAALYGHTHRSFLSRQDGLLIMNPGAVMNGAFGVLTVTDGEVEGELFGPGQDR